MFAATVNMQNFVPLEMDSPQFNFPDFDVKAFQDASQIQNIVPLDSSADLVPIARKQNFENF